MAERSTESVMHNDSDDSLSRWFGTSFPDRGISACINVSFRLPFTELVADKRSRAAFSTINDKLKHAVSVSEVVFLSNGAKSVRAMDSVPLCRMPGNSTQTTWPSKSGA